MIPPLGTGSNTKALLIYLTIRFAFYSVAWERSDGPATTLTRRLSQPVVFSVQHNTITQNLYDHGLVLDFFSS